MRLGLGLRISVLILACGITACAGRILQIDKADEVLKVDEFEEKVEIKAEPPPPPVVKDIVPPGPTLSAKKKPKAPKVSEVKPPTKGPRQPELEDSAGFDGRRPLVDPFRPGEKVTFDVSYFAMTAGQINMEVKPFVTVNGARAYKFEVNGRTNSFFSRVYEVDDRLTTYVDFNNLVPISLEVSIKESSQLVEARTFFDHKTNRASYWRKRITKEKGERSKKLEWDILPYSQNVVSAAYYLRNFQLDVGKKLAFRVADEGKNIVFTGEVLRKEKLKTPIGELDTVVVRPQITADGVFKPIGDILIWLTDDERKFFVRLESKIKIGTIVAKLKSIEKGQE